MSPMPSPRRRLTAVLAVAICAGCATAEPPRRYAMPADLSLAISPERAAPDSAAELAEAALGLLDPARPGGPDLVGAANLALLCAEVAVPRTEGELRDACHRTAARSALRAGDRELYVETIDRWEIDATHGARIAGELALHRAIRDRIRGETGRVPRELSGWLRETEARP